MSKRIFNCTAVAAMGALFAGCCKKEYTEQPNFIVLLADDMGYADLSCFESEKNVTPQLDRMAAEGMKFTSFYAAASVSSPSRAALMTGRYPKREGLHIGVFFPDSASGIGPAETTIASLLRSAGYTTACIGKWHLGHRPEHLPTSNGFDLFFGVPYSTDMDSHDSPEAMAAKVSVTNLDETWRSSRNESWRQWDIPLIRNTTVIEQPVDLTGLTQRFTTEAISFIRKSRKHPFFLMLAYTTPHVPLFVSESFYEPDVDSAYRQTIAEIDDSVGQVLEELRKTGLDKNTYVIFTSDNGPWLEKKHHGGSAHPFRAGKRTSYEGGHRVPCIAWSPHYIPANTVCDQLATLMDFVPTFTALAAAPLPEDRVFDGKNIVALLSGANDAQLPHDTFFYYASRGAISGVRHENWKLKFENNQPELYNLSTDIGEQNNLAAVYPEKVNELKNAMLLFDRQLEENCKKERYLQ
ncbi:MAG: sulfatase [Kiritimatiellales bacterium]